uniref:Uncharacterized protein n=1 Tax=Timema bartmani TaxID=61472 RepID=A0A7R9EVU9_9NEOP|nr:unnamed protein product [Timema bartmani]
MNKFKEVLCKRRLDVPTGGRCRGIRVSSFRSLEWVMGSNTMERGRQPAKGAISRPQTKKHQTLTLTGVSAHSLGQVESLDIGECQRCFYLGLHVAIPVLKYSSSPTDLEAVCLVYTLSVSQFKFWDVGIKKCITPGPHGKNVYERALRNKAGLRRDARSKDIKPDNILLDEEGKKGVNLNTSTTSCNDGIDSGEDVKEGIPKEPELRAEENHFGKSTLNTPDRDSNLDLPVIDSLIQCDSSALDHVATYAGTSTRKREEGSLQNLEETQLALGDGADHNTEK